MNALRCCTPTVPLTPSDAHLIPDQPDASPGSPVSFDLVRQALNGVRQLARQVFRHLDCRPCLPSDLEAPASYGPLADTVADAVVASVPSEPATEEPPQPKPLKAVLLPQDHEKRTQRVRFADTPSVREIPARAQPDTTDGAAKPDAEAEVSPSQDTAPRSKLFVDPSCLRFTILETPTGDAATEGFKAAVRQLVSKLHTNTVQWENLDGSMGQRMALLQDRKQALQELQSLTRAFKKSLKADPAALACANAAEVRRALSDKLVELELEVGRTDKFIGLCRQQLEAEQHESASSERMSSVSVDVSEDSEVDEGLDFSGILLYEKGDTEAIVRSMRAPLAQQIKALGLLDSMAKAEEAGSLNWRVAVTGIINSLSHIDDLLMSHLLAYRGRDRQFGEWMSSTLDAVNIEQKHWEQALDRYSVNHRAFDY